MRQAFVVMIGLFAAVIACGDNTKAACTSDTECHSTACMAEACQKSTCVAVPLASGAIASEQVSGNCKLATCDGSGNIVQTADDSNLPANSNPCVIAACSSGEPASYYAQEETACGSGMRCNATGLCVACNGPLECPGGPDSQCHARTCIDNACGIAYARLGFVTSTPAQVPGSCQDIVCNGSGSTEMVIDNNNVPASTNCATAGSGATCTVGSCNAGTPVNTPGVCSGSGVTAMCVTS